MTVSLNLASSSSRRPEDVAQLKTLTSIAQAVARSKRVVVVTGAGISCSCGIPDFRSTDGLYNLVKAKYPNVVVKGRDLFDASLFRDPTSSAIFYTFIAGLKASIDSAQPSPTHHFIKTLDTKGKLLRSYTQNIDGLEERSGLLGTSSDEVKGKGKGKAKGKLRLNEVKSVLLHGDIHRVRCTMCSASFMCTQEHLDKFNTGVPPDCPECSARSLARVARSARPIAIGTLRPAIVLYDEPHPLGDEIGAIETRDLARKPDLLIIMGTSLKVHGLKKLVKEFANTIHQNESASSQKTQTTGSRSFLNKVIFVNKTPPSSEWAGIIDYHVAGSTDAWVEQVLAVWKKCRPSDWEAQQTLDEFPIKKLKDLPGAKTKVSKKMGARQENDENEAIFSSQETLVDQKPYKSLKGKKSFTFAGVDVPPRRGLHGSNSTHTAPPLSPSKRLNRTYSRSPSTTDMDTEVASDDEPPCYDSESERGSPRKKKKNPEDMSLDDIDIPEVHRGMLFKTGSSATTTKGSHMGAKLKNKASKILDSARTGTSSNQLFFAEFQHSSS
ncbi:hypothetical protein FRC03_012553 [Tulasnella sp. 419]|nr:hypothetical protein FRC03_012553 [Tulasnella sp. 419]